MKTEQKVTAWEVVKASREVRSELGLEESSGSSGGREEEENTRQRKQHAHVRRTHWHEITRQVQVSASSSEGLDHRVLCWMDLLSTPVGWELYSIPWMVPSYSWTRRGTCVRPGRQERSSCYTLKGLPGR